MTLIPASVQLSKLCRISKSTLAIASLFSIASFSATAQEQHYERAQKELRIMSKIFETSLSDQVSHKTRILGSHKSQATYLAKQGMVFTFNFGRNSFGSPDEWAAFGEGIGHFVGEMASELGAALGDAVEAPHAPVEPDIGFDIEDRLEAAQERREALEMMREVQQVQREEVRELQREIRRIERERENRDIEKDQIDEIKRELENKVDILKGRMEEYKKSMTEYRTKRDEKYTQSAKLKSETIVSTLCDYGATLRSLKNDEYVTLIFNGYSNGKDKVYVFEYDDVRNCQSAEKLLKSSINYQL